MGPTDLWGGVTADASVSAQGEALYRAGHQVSEEEGSLTPGCHESRRPNVPGSVSRKQQT